MRVDATSSARFVISASRHPPPTVPSRAPRVVTSILAVALMGSDPRRRATVASAPSPPSAARRAHSERIDGSATRAGYAAGARDDRGTLWRGRAAPPYYVFPSIAGRKKRARRRHALPRTIFRPVHD